MFTLSQTTIEAYLKQQYGTDTTIESLEQLGGATAGKEALKAFGYGKPLCVTLRDHKAGEQKRIVLHQITHNGFGRERDSDRVAEAWLNYSTFNLLPRHVPAVDLVGLTEQGTLASVGHLQELMVVTGFVAGQPYADDLIRIRDTRTCTPLDVERASTLAHYLAEIHQLHFDDPLLWRRRLRDLIGHGEGIMGLTDSYPPDFSLANADKLRAIEEAANRWRWKLKPLHSRLTQVHGDFHPFNVLFEHGTHFHLLDRSRGAWGEPADDVSCMAINYLFFSLQAFGELTGPFADLHRVFWQTYLAQRHDEQLLRVIQPWYAWRALVLASPQWYPTLTDEVRRKLLTFAQRVLESDEVAWEGINAYLEDQ